MFKIYKEKYVVYDNGDVYIIGTKEVRKLKPWVTNSSYKQVNINRKAEYLHRVIIEAFRGKSDMQVDHIDGNKNNNTLKNLQYLTSQENVAKSVGYKVEYDGKVYNSMAALARKLGVSAEGVRKQFHGSGFLRGKEIIKKYN